MYNKPHDLRYVSSKGITVDLSGWPFLWEMTDLLDYKWDYTSTPNISGQGAKLSRFAKREQEKSVKIAVFSDAMPVADLIGDLSAILEADILAETPGRLYIGNQYCAGYMVDSSKSITRNTRIAKMALRFVTHYPFWITEQLCSFPLFTAGASAGFILPTKIPMRIGAVLNATQLANNHYAASSAIMVIYGPITDPSFSIGNHIYTISGTLGVGERYEIDQPLRTVTKITSSGERINAFAYRGKTYSVFEPIPVGENTLYYNGSFAIDITLLKERSEPLWV